ncbi:hypothetical protein B0H17DRAFT_1133102 [Mycena rosella]|uniref:Uncharacterized protein n=1 Tax=Mycena rosella TaxID=1033263 RepID=A0AAD7DIS7_MYCRO|nr:hypothetical protein B0H17DRAFT_1133102 [Mycena rosella]
MYEKRGEISGWRNRNVRGGVSVDGVLQKAKREKTTWNTRRELSDERRGDEDNGANLNTSQQKITAIKKSRKNNLRKGQPHPDNDEQLQYDEEQPRAPRNPAGNRGNSNETQSEMRAQSSVGVRTDSFVRRSSSERRTTTEEGAGYTARTDEGGEMKTPDQNSSEIADICKLQMKTCSTRSMLHETRRAREQSPDGTPAQGVERVEEGWSDVRASASKRGAATHDLRARPTERCPSHAGKRSLRRTPCTETCKREPPEFRIPTIEKTRKEKTGKRWPHPRNNCPLPPQCGPGRRERRSRRQRTNVAVVLENRPCAVVLVVLRLGFRRAFVRRVAMLPLDARRASRSWVAVTEEQVALEVMEGWKEQGHQRAKEEVELLEKEKRAAAGGCAPIDRHRAMSACSAYVAAQEGCCLACQSGRTVHSVRVSTPDD